MNLWHVQEDSFNPKKLHVGETVYSIGNGYFGTRGTFEEDYPKAMPATLLYGVFDDIPIGKEELANVPNWLPLKLFVNGERFRLDRGTILEYHRTLDMQNGILSRFVRWESPRGDRLKIEFERIASLADEHVGAIRYSVTVEEQAQGANGDLDVSLSASLNIAVGNDYLMHWETVDQGHEGDLAWLHTETISSGVQLVQAMSFTSLTPGFQKDVFDSDYAPSIQLKGKLSRGGTVTTEKIVVMYTSRDLNDPRKAALEHLRTIMEAGRRVSEPNLHAALSIEPAQQSRYDIQVETSTYRLLLTKHEEAWHRYWQPSDIIIEGDNKSQQAIRYNIYQMRISTSWHDTRYSIAAKGLTGFGYRGHIFHDTEIFMLPYFTYVHPNIARNLLLYRYHLLPAARAKAEHNGFKGAQYPWESTLDGVEATPESIIHPESGEVIEVLNGLIELHITASIAYAVGEYWRVTGDDAFMRDYGAEMLLSTAMFWASRAEYHPERNDYEISNVIGPDEWHEHVNNNAYTNYMARWNIRAGLHALQWLRATQPEKAEELTHHISLSDSDLDLIRDVTERIRIPQDKNTGLIEQFDGFFKLAPFDQKKYKGRKASYQAILGMNPVHEHQVIKQADVLQLLTILNQDFDLKTKRVNWDYYYPITDHEFGSSLTPALHAILACELGHVDTAYKLFLVGALVDLEDFRGNADKGIHDACAGAVWQATVFGFAGLRFTDEGHTTSPSWPDGWTRLAFTCFHRGKRISIDLRRS